MNRYLSAREAENKLTDAVAMQLALLEEVGISEESAEEILTGFLNQARPEEIIHGYIVGRFR